MSAVTDVREAIAAAVAGQVPRDLESSTLDFKTVGRSRNDALEDLAEAMACFANSARRHRRGRGRRLR